MILLDEKRLHRILKRMAYEVVETSAGRDVDLVGLNERGYAVSSVIESHIRANFSSKVFHQQLFVDGSEKPGEIDRKHDVLIIADDVIYSGKTMFKALNTIPELYNYKDVYTAAVIDRGHRKIPVEAGITGIIVPTKINEHVDFQLLEGKPNRVFLTKK